VAVVARVRRDPENAGVVMAGSLPCPGRIVPCFLLPQALAVLELRRLALDNVLDHN